MFSKKLIEYRSVPISKEFLEQQIRTAFAPYDIQAGDLTAYNVAELKAIGIQGFIAAAIVQFVEFMKQQGAQELQMPALVVQQILQVLKHDFQVKITEYKRDQERAKLDLQRSLAQGQMNMNENTKVTYFSPGTKEVTLNLEDTYPKDKYTKWEEAVLGGDKSGIYPALVIGALSGSGKTYFEFHLAKKHNCVIVFTVLFSVVLVRDLRKAIGTSTGPIRPTLDAIVERFVRFHCWTVEELRREFANEPDIELYILRYLFNGGSKQIQLLYDQYPNLTIPSTKTKFIFAIDEAVLFNEFWNQVPQGPEVAMQGAQNGNFLTLLVSACQKFGPVLCFSTKFSETEIRNVGTSAADMKRAMRITNSTLPAFLMQDVKYFVSKFLQLSGNNMELVAFFLQGRPRLCELFVHSIISYGEHSCIQSSTTFIQGALAEVIQNLSAIGNLVTPQVVDFLASKTNIGDGIVERWKYAWELIFFGYCNFEKDKRLSVADLNTAIRDTIFSGISCTIISRNEAVLIEPAFKLMLRTYVTYDLEDASFVKMMNYFVENRATAVAQLIAASCICSFTSLNSMTDHPLFHGLKGTIYDRYSINFTNHVIIHDHGGHAKFTSVLGMHQLSSAVLNFLLTDVEKNDALVAELISAVLVPCQNNRSDIVAFATKHDKKKCSHLPDIIPVVVSVNSFGNRKINDNAQAKLLQDLHNTKISNLYSTKHGLQNNNTSQAHGANDLLNVVKCVERSNLYIRVLFHPWLQTDLSSQTSLESLLSEEATKSTFYDNGFAAINNNTGIIQVSQNSPAFNRIKQRLSNNPDALHLLDRIAK